MTEREVVLAALAAVVAAVAAVRLPWWAAAGVAALSLVVRRPVAVVAAVAVVVSCLASRAEAGIAVVARPESVRGVAVVVSPPEWRWGRATAEVRLDGRRYRAEAVDEASAVLAAADVGAEVRIAGRSSALDAPWAWMASRHLAGALRVTSAEHLSDGRWWWRAAGGVHLAVERGAGGMAPDHEALFLGVVLGDDRTQSVVQRHRFRVSGLAHLTAVSGQNVAFALLVVSPLLRCLGLRTRWLATGAVLAWFALVTRLEPSVLRAVGMAAVAATVAWQGRYASGLRIVSVALVGLLLADPLLVWSMGFRLSASASVALVVLARPLSRRLGGPWWWREPMAASLAAMAGTAPWLVSFAGSVPAAGPLLNLIAVPVAGWLMVWGLTAVPVAGAVGGPLAAVAAAAAEWMCRWLAAVAEFGAAPWWPHLGPVGVGVVTCGIVAWAFGRWSTRAGRRPIAVAVVSLAAFAVALDAWWVPRRAATSAEGTATLHVDGSAAVLELGPRPDEARALELLVAARRLRVDAIVATGGGKLAGQAVWTLREAVDVGVVLAADPTDVRDARQLSPGTLEVGDLRVHLRPRRDRR